MYFIFGAGASVGALLTRTTARLNVIFLFITYACFRNTSENRIKNNDLNIPS